MGPHSQSQRSAGQPEGVAPAAEQRGVLRLRTPVRDQIALPWLRLDEILPPDHRARQVWAFVEQLDLSAFYRLIKASAGRPGHPHIDPRLLVGLWLYAALEQVGSARLLARLCREHLGFRWMCGGVSVNYHTLAEFRVAHPEILDDLLTTSFAACLHAGLASLERVAQDGVRVRASAGAASFRRQPRLAEYRALARAGLDRLRAELHADPAAGTRRQRAAQERAAREREARVSAALAAVEALARGPANRVVNAPPPQDPSGGMPDARPAEAPPEAPPSGARGLPPRASTTDVEARVMKMADGGFRPAFNVQFATTLDSQLIAAVAIGNVGSDQGQLAPMVRQLTARYGQPPRTMLVDGGFTKLADIQEVSASGATTVYAPVPKPRKPARDPHAPHPGDTAAVAAWRVRMATPEAKAIYKDRAATAECVNALARNRGLQRFLVRGVTKAKAVVLWFALAHNVARMISLHATAA